MYITYKVVTYQLPLWYLVVVIVGFAKATFVTAGGEGANYVRHSGIIEYHSVCGTQWLSKRSRYRYVVEKVDSRLDDGLLPGSRDISIYILVSDFLRAQFHCHLRVGCPSRIETASAWTAPSAFSAWTLPVYIDDAVSSSHPDSGQMNCVSHPRPG